MQAYLDPRLRGGDCTQRLFFDCSSPAPPPARGVTSITAGGRICL